MARVVIDKQKCKGCLLCIDVCPKNMLEVDKVINKNGYFPARFKEENNKCIGCAICAQRCPDIAIKEVYK